MNKVQLVQIALSILVAIVGTAVAFYVKDYQERKALFRKLKSKLEKIAGRNAKVIYKDEVYRLVEFDEGGVMLQNDMKSVFLPTGMLLQNEMVLPTDDYERKKKEKEKEQEAKELEMFKSVIGEQYLESLFSKLTSQFDVEFEETRNERKKQREFEQRLLELLKFMVHRIEGKALTVAEKEDPFQIIIRAFAHALAEHSTEYNQLLDSNPTSKPNLDKA